jgi:aminodeoxyfutalosine synthase
VGDDRARLEGVAAMMTIAEARELLETPDVISIGVRADDARRARHQNRVTFVRVLDVSVDAPSPSSVPAAAGEVRVTGAPASLDRAVQAIAAIERIAGGTPLTGFVLHDLEALAAREHVALPALAARLRRAGMHAVAEARIDRLRDPRVSLIAALEGGLGIARLTIEMPPPDVIALLDRVRDAVAGLPLGAGPAFAPLPRTVDPAMPTTGYDDVKLVAIARLFLDNIETIQVDWSRYGPKLAQVALTFGANDLDAVPLDPPNVNLLGPRRAPLEEVRRNIRAASLEPVERNGRFEVLAAT